MSRHLQNNNKNAYHPAVTLQVPYNIDKTVDAVAKPQYGEI